VGCGHLGFRFKVLKRVACENAYARVFRTPARLEMKSTTSSTSLCSAFCSRVRIQSVPITSDVAITPQAPQLLRLSQ